MFARCSALETVRVGTGCSLLAAPFADQTNSDVYYRVGDSSKTQYTKNTAFPANVTATFSTYPVETVTVTVNYTVGTTIKIDRAADDTKVDQWTATGVDRTSNLEPDDYNLLANNVKAMKFRTLKFCGNDVMLRVADDSTTAS